MIRGFAKEEDQEEVPMVPQRAYLPPGVSNFVTPAGTRKKKRVCSLFFCTPNGQKSQPAEVASYDLLRYNLNDPPRISN